MRSNEKITAIESEVFKDKRVATEIRSTVVAAISSSNPELKKVKCNVDRFHKRVTIRAKFKKRVLYAKGKNASAAMTRFEDEIRTKLENAEW